MKIGLYGGTFDPFHNGHLLPVRAARSALGLDRVLYLPTARPPHKRRRMAPPEARYAMVELALLQEDGFYASPFEMQSGRPAYTVDTLEHFADASPGDRLFLIVGEDAFAALPSWRDWRKILTLAELAILTRPDRGTWEELAPELRRALAEGRAHRVANEPVAVSSTAVRRAIADHSPGVERWLPPLVLDYVRKYDLYSTDTNP